MSIIHEALKKAQDNLKHLPPPMAAAPQIPVAPTIGATQPPRPAMTITQPELPPLQPSVAKPAPPAIPMKYLVFALIVIAALFVLQQAAAMFAKLHTAKTQALAAQSVPPPAPVAPLPVQNIAPTTPVATDVTASAPEQPESYERSYGSQLVLNGVTVTNGQKMALINNGIYQIGDEIMGKTIVNINLDGVELMDGDQKIILKTR